MKPLEIKRTIYNVSDFVSWQKAKSLVLKGTAPKAVLDAVTRRTTNKDSRLAVLNYFHSETQHG